MKTISEGEYNLIVIALEKFEEDQRRFHLFDYFLPRYKRVRWVNGLDIDARKILNKFYSGKIKINEK